MPKRLANNTNIKLIQQPEYEGLTINQHVGYMGERYLYKLKSTAMKALEEHHRTLAVRFDLRLPTSGVKFQTFMISEFIRRLRMYIANDLKNKSISGSRVHPCNMRYSWAKEQNISDNPHYHCVIYLNKDCYYSVGDINANEGNLASIIKRAWADTLGMNINNTRGLVQFCGECQLDANSAWIEQYLSDYFVVISYLAKVHTKNYGDGSKCFSCSNN
jgi:hypothetical protein